MCVHNYSAYEGSIVENISSQIERLCSQIERHCSRCLTAKGRHNGGEARAIKLTRQIFFSQLRLLICLKKKKEKIKLTLGESNYHLDDFVDGAHFLV